MLKRTLLPVMLWCMLFPLAVFAQAGYKSEDELIKSAEKYFDDKNYEKAFPLFSQIVSNRPDNSHYNYCLGVCIMKAGTDKAEAIRFLDIATKSPQNPADAWLYLGNAYHFSYRYDEAIAAYESYKTMAGKSSWNNAKGDLLIRMCKNGIQVKNDLSLNRHRILEKSEIEWADFYTLYRNLGDWGRFLKLPKEYEDKNTKERPESAYLFLSTKGNVMMYSNAGKSSDNGFDIFKVIKDQKGMWMFPEALAEIINTSGDEAYPVIINEGKTIFFSSKGERSTGGYDVFRSDFDAATGRWSDPVSMGPPVNSPADDYYYVPSADNSIAYFASNRESQGTKCHVYKASINKEDKNFVTINGLFNCAAGLELSDARVTVLDPATSAIVAELRTASQQGTYFLKLPAGSTYVYRVELVGFNTQEDVMDLSSNTAPELIQEILLVRNDQGKENMTITNRVPEKSQTVAANKPGQLLQVGANDQLSPAATLSENDRMIAARSNNSNATPVGKVATEKGTSGNGNQSNEVNGVPSSNSNTSAGEIDPTQSTSSKQSVTPKSESVSGASKAVASNADSGKIQYGNNAGNNTNTLEGQPVAMNAHQAAGDEKSMQESHSVKGNSEQTKQGGSQNVSGQETPAATTSSENLNRNTLRPAAVNGTDSPAGTQDKSNAAGNNDASATENSRVATTGNGHVNHETYAVNSSEKNQQASPVAVDSNSPTVTGGVDNGAAKGNDSPVALNTNKNTGNQQESSKGASSSGQAEKSNSKNDNATKPQTAKVNASDSGNQTTAPSSGTLPDGAVATKSEVSPVSNAQDKTEGGAATADPSKSENGKVQTGTSNSNSAAAPVAVKSSSPATSNAESNTASTPVVSANGGTQKTNSENSSNGAIPSTSKTSSAAPATQVAMNSGSNNAGTAAQQETTATNERASEKPAGNAVAENNLQPASAKQEPAGVTDQSLALNTKQEQKTASGTSQQTGTATAQKAEMKADPSTTSNGKNGGVPATQSPASNVNSKNDGSGTSTSKQEPGGVHDATYHLPAEQPVAANQGQPSGTEKATTADAASPVSGKGTTKESEHKTTDEHSNGNAATDVKQPDKTAAPASEEAIAENGKKSRKGGLFGRRNKESKNEPAVAEVPVTPVPAAPEAEEELYKNLVFRVQLGAYKDRSVDELRQKYTAMGLTDLVYVKNEAGLLLVMTGSENSYTSAIALKEAMIAKGVPDAFIVVYSEGARLPVQMVVRVEE